jgi:hypothetical protein
MKQTDYLSPEANRFIDEFFSEHDVQLIGEETSERDFDDSSRHNVKFTRHIFLATGFSWSHPSGVTISGEFDKPVEAIVRLTDDDGKFERTFHDDKVCEAIVAMCGPISGFAESALI